MSREDYPHGEGNLVGCPGSRDLARFDLARFDLARFDLASDFLWSSSSLRHVRSRLAPSHLGNHLGSLEKYVKVLQYRPVDLPVCVILLKLRGLLI